MRIIVEIDDDAVFYDDDGAQTTAFEKVFAALDFCEIPAYVYEEKRK